MQYLTADRPGVLSLASIYCVGHGGGPGDDVHNDSCKDRSFYIEIHRDQSMRQYSLV